MALAVSTSTCMCSASVSSFPTDKTTIFTLRVSVLTNPTYQKFHLSSLVSQLGLSPFSLWSGLKHMGISFSRQSVKSGGNKKCKGKGVYASLFGVGAPEALVIGVVALLVFGPKGLAEVARNLGKTLRAFQPTIKELQEVSREFKSTLEREIGLDDIQSSMPNTYRSSSIQTPSNTSSEASFEESQSTDPNGSASTNRAYTSEEYLKIRDEELKASAAKQQNQTEVESQAKSQDTVQEAAVVTTPPQKPEVET